MMEEAVNEGTPGRAPGASPVELELLVPTYRRRDPLVVNLGLIGRRLREEKLAGRVRVRVSDNASDDGTREACQAFAAANPDIDFHYSAHAENCGLEGNALGMLETAEAPAIMFLSDDDHLPAGYLGKVLAVLADDPGISCVIPGYANVYPDGNVVVRWSRPEAERVWTPGWRSLVELANRGHQMSGIAMRRPGLAETYLREGGRFRSVHLFTAFLTTSLTRGAALVLGKCMIEVCEGAERHWSTDSCGLLRESYRSFRAAIPDRPWTESLVQMSAFLQQPFRLRWRSPRRFYRAVRDVVSFELTRPATSAVLVAAAVGYTLLLPAILLLRTRGEGAAVWVQERERRRGAAAG